MIYNLIKTTLIFLLIFTNSYSDEKPFNSELMLMHYGASNLNYCLKNKNLKYFIKCSPQKGEHLFADLAIEVEVLKKLQPLNISPIPIYFDEENRLLILNFIESESELINLQSPENQTYIFNILHQIEESKISINRNYLPYSTFIYLLNQAHKFNFYSIYSDFFLTALPILKDIEIFIESNSKKSLCHLDLHRKNLIKSNDKIFIIDWEYAAMAHPLLTLASMASIERWSDQEMVNALNRYYEKPTAEDYKILYLYRFSMDVFWTLWNDIQSNLKPTDQPYDTWRDLFFNDSLLRFDFLKNQQFYH